MKALKKIHAVFITLAVMAVILSCSTVGGAIRDTSEDQFTPEEEYYIGRAVGANVLSAYKLQTNAPSLTAYVNQICNALIINSKRPEIFNGYHAAILDSDEINAFATPGGHIFITRGLIACATSEDTLAAVIAHEVGHIQLEHGLNVIRKNRNTKAGVDLARNLVSTFGPSQLAKATDIFGDAVGEAVTTMVTNGYSRDQEFEADSKALELLSLAGYEPSSLLDMLRVLEKNQSGHPGGFNNTHPSPKDRSDKVQGLLSKYKVPDTRSFREARYKAVK